MHLFGRTKSRQTRRAEERARDKMLDFKIRTEKEKQRARALKEQDTLQGQERLYNWATENLPYFSVFRNSSSIIGNCPLTVYTIFVALVAVEFGLATAIINIKRRDMYTPQTQQSAPGSSASTLLKKIDTPTTLVPLPEEEVFFTESNC